jgi:hypothetical protein
VEPVVDPKDRFLPPDNGGGAWKYLVVTVIVALIAAAAYFLYWHKEPAPEPAPAPVAPAEPAAPPEVHYPAPEAPEQPVKLPALDNSDKAVADSLVEKLGQSIRNFLIPIQIIRHAVATIDSLDRDPIPLSFRPVKYVPGLPPVETEGGVTTLSFDNDRRYKPFIAAVKAADAKRVVEVYRLYYPLFQKAYAELGYPKQEFNDRLIHIIDHLLAAPEPREAVELVRPKVLYEFADPDLEKRSWGQKAMIRMGPPNERVVKAKLREIRALLVRN